MQEKITKGLVRVVRRGKRPTAIGKKTAIGMPKRRRIGSKARTPAVNGGIAKATRTTKRPARAVATPRRAGAGVRRAAARISARTTRVGVRKTSRTRKIGEGRGRSSRR